MSGILRKIGRLIKHRRDVISHLRSDFYEENLSNIIRGHKIDKLPEIEITDILELFSYKNETNIKIKSDFSGGISPVNDYYFLCLIARAINVKKYFEIGTWVGLSSYNISVNLAGDVEIYTLDIPPDHPEIALYKIPNEIFGIYSRDLKNVHFLKSDSKTFDFSSFKKQFDLVFVDGNHYYDYVVNDSKAALELLKNENSVIAWHDYILGGELNKKVLAGILDGMPSSEHKHIYSLYQSNLALYSKSFNFERKEFDKWNVPRSKFDITAELTGP